MKMTCRACYKPVILDGAGQPVRRRREAITKTAFLIHSSRAEDRHVLVWVRHILNLYGVSTVIVEEDARPLDFLEKSRHAVDENELVVALLTKRYRYEDEASREMKWKGSDKCYDEIAMSFMRSREMFAFVEEGVDPGRILERVWWYAVFRRRGRNLTIENGQDLFQRLELYTGSIKWPAVVYKLI